MTKPLITILLVLSVVLSLSKNRLTTYSMQAQTDLFERSKARGFEAVCNV